jgi:VWFA-related protein
MFGLAAASPNVQIAAQTVGQPGYTIQANARVVLTDIVVLDKNGDPVRGLHQSAFHILDNGKPQEIRSFDEHSGPAIVGTAAPDASLPAPGSNEYLRHPLPVYNVVMLDTSTMDVLDQMYLNQQIVKFIDALPPGQPLAIYVHNGDVALQLQNFTADHDLLSKAVRRAIPKLQQPGAYQLSDQDALKQMAMYLAQLPGRKNLLWFTGGSNLFLLADATDLASSPGGTAAAQAAAPAPGLATGQTLAGQVDMRETFDRLEAARIAVYPIDIRGLTTSSDAAMDAQQTFMQEQAESTGGHAFFNTNGLKQVAQRVVADDNSFYTLTYTPKDFKMDDKWHRVKVSVDGGNYQLSYRQGYYGDSGKIDAEKPGSKPLLTKDGEAIAAPEDRSQPIIFEASAVAAAEGAPTPAEKHGERAYQVHYIVPAAVFQTQSVTDGAQVRIGAGVLAFDADGRPVQHKIEEVKMTFDDTILKTKPQSKLAFDEAIDLPKGSNYLYVVVWDMATGKMGTLQLPVQVTKR